MMMNSQSSVVKTLLRLVPCLVLATLAVCLPASAQPSLKQVSQEELQGKWEGEGPPGKITVTIDGDTLHFYAREDFWYETTFSLPPGTQELHAVIQDSATPDNSKGDVVLALVKIEEGILTLAVADNTTVAPASFWEAPHHYNVKKVAVEDPSAR